MARKIPKKIIRQLTISSATNFLALIFSIYFIVMIDNELVIPLDFSLAFISLATILLNIPFILLNNIIIAKYITYTIKKRLGSSQFPPFRVKLPFYLILLVYFIPIVSESLIFYFLMVNSYRNVINFNFDLFYAFLIVILSRSVLLILRPILYGKGEERHGF